AGGRSPPYDFVRGFSCRSRLPWSNGFELELACGGGRLDRMSSEPADPPKEPSSRGRNWPRTIVVAATICVAAAAIGVVATFFLRLERQREIVRAIEAKGGVVFYDYQDVHLYEYWQDLHNPHRTPPGPAFVRAIL